MLACLRGERGDGDERGKEGRSDVQSMGSCQTEKRKGSGEKRDRRAAVRV